MRHLLRVITAVVATSTTASVAFGQGKVVSLPPVKIAAKAVTDGDSIDVTGTQITRVGEAQIKDLSAHDIPSALRRTPGVSITRFNPVGSFGGGAGGSVFIRGMGNSRPGSEIKTYIDGVPFYMSVWNHPLTDLLPVSGVDRIDVYKGPAPHRFGNSFAAINLVPRAATVDQVGGNISLATGHFGTVVQSSALSGKTDKFDASLSQSYTKSNGHRPLANGELSNGMIHAGYNASKRWRVDLTALATSNHANDPGMINQPATRTGRYSTTGAVAILSAKHIGTTSNGSIRVYKSSGSGDWFNQPDPDGNTLSNFDFSGIQLKEDIRTAFGSTVITGIDVDKISGRVDFEPTSPQERSHFTSPQLQLVQPHMSVSRPVTLSNSWTITPSLGARYYSHSHFESSTAPHAGVVLRNTSSFEVRIRGARGYNYPGVDAVVLSKLIPALGDSWKNLKAERMDQYELGGRFSLSGSELRSFLIQSATIDWSVFSQSSGSRYQFAFPPIAMPPSFLNLTGYKARGGEASIQLATTGGVSSFLSYSALRPQGEGIVIPFSPNNQMSAGIVWQRSELRLGLDMQAQGETVSAIRGRATGSVELPSVPGFSVWNARAAVSTERVGVLGELFLSVENLLDRPYQYLVGYPMAGRWATFGVRAGF